MNTTIAETMAMMAPADWSQVKPEFCKAMLDSLGKQDDGIAKSIMSNLGMFDGAGEMSARLLAAGGSSIIRPNSRERGKRLRINTATAITPMPAAAIVSNEFSS